MLAVDTIPDIDSISLGNKDSQSPHSGVQCFKCNKHLGYEVRILCLRCDNVSFCESCNKFGNFESESHSSRHELIRLRDSSNLTEQKIREYREKKEKEAPEFDSFAFQTWRKKELKNDPRAFELIKKMLRKENEYRLSEYYLNEYKKKFK